MQGYLWKRRAVLVIGLSALRLATGCATGSDLAPQTRYSGLRVNDRTPMNKFRVYRTFPPERRYRDIGTVTVRCPTEANASPYGTITVEGGCSYENVVAFASEEAAGAGAHGLFNIQTSTAANGVIVSLVATAFRFDAPPPPPSNLPSEQGKAVPEKPLSPPPAPSIEERLLLLKALRDKSAITAEDYEKRKAEILKQI